MYIYNVCLHRWYGLDPKRAGGLGGPCPALGAAAPAGGVQRQAPGGSAAGGFLGQGGREAGRQGGRQGGREGGREGHPLSLSK